mmetsp:Transcript_31922/g.42563  ORF Transcript_31922/g.42563 Transcript_31922/m.42563 type:complete len:115 (-) Transcript_31922:627-971(-)
MSLIICKSEFLSFLFFYSLSLFLLIHKSIQKSSCKKKTPQKKCKSALQTYRKETEDGEEMELHSSEVAALMNLVVTDTMVEEAVALIPSLSRFPEAAIDEILDLIRSTMIRIVS